MPPTTRMPFGTLVVWTLKTCQVRPSRAVVYKAQEGYGVCIRPSRAVVCEAQQGCGV